MSLKSNRKKTDVSKEELNVESRKTSSRTKRLASENRSPRIPLLKGKTNIKEEKPKGGHSQTFDCLRQTIKAKNDQIAAINNSIMLYIQTINEKDKQIKAFESMSLKLKDQLINSSGAVKKINQCNMFFLTFYKDFEAMVKEETKHMMSQTNHKYKKLQEQLEASMKLFDMQSNEQLTIENQAIFTELDSLMKEYEESSRNVQELLTRKDSLTFSKISLDETSNLISCLSGIDRTLECTSPASHSNRSTRRERAESFSWMINSNMDLDQLRKDIVKLTEENKYLKKRLGGSGYNISNLKCEICPSYVEKITTLSREKEECQRELFEKYETERINCDRVTDELKTLQVKFDNQQKELLDKLKIEGSLNTQISELQMKNEELSTQIKQTIEAKEGFEYLQNTVSDLSLALINKNEKDLSYKQIQLIKNLFGDAQISAINTYKEKIDTLELEKSKAHEISKKLVDQNREIMKPFRKYAIAVKECVDLYLFLDAANSDFSDSDTKAYMNKHATDFITEYEDNVNEMLPKLNDNIKLVQSCIAELNRQSDHLEIAQYDLMLESPMSKKSYSPNKSGAKDNSLVLSTPTHNFEASDFMARLAFSSYNTNDPHDYTPITNEEELSKDDQLSLIQKLKNKEREVEELKAKLGVNCKMTKKIKKKGNKSTKKATNIKEKQEKMMQDALDELQMLVEEDEKSPFEY